MYCKQEVINIKQTKDVTLIIFSWWKYNLKKTKTQGKYKEF